MGDELEQMLSDVSLNELLCRVSISHPIHVSVESLRARLAELEAENKALSAIAKVTANHNALLVAVAEAALQELPRSVAYSKTWATLDAARKGGAIK